MLGGTSSSKACGPEGNAREEELRKGALGRVKSLSVYPYSSHLGPMAHIPPAPLPPPPSSSPELNSSPSTSLLTSLDAAAADRVDIVPADPIVDNECAVCLLPITASTLARLAACPHVFHNFCIRQWHDTRHRNGQVPNCPSCRKCGPLTAAWPSFDFYRSFVFGPSGLVTLLPHIIVIRTHYLCSSNTKQIIRFVDIQRFQHKRNYVYLYDHSDELIISFRPSPFPQFLQLFIQNIKQHNPHITLTSLLQSNDARASIGPRGRASMLA